MKLLKYFLFVNIFIITITYSAFASLEINFNGHYGIAFPFNSIKVNDNYKNTIYDSVDGNLGFEGNLLFQIGNYFKLFENDYTSIIKGVSLFGDIGFSVNALMSDYINGLSNYSADGKLYYSKNENGQLVYDDYKFHRVDTIRNNSPKNWWDAITRTGFRQQYNLSVSGGNAKTKFLVSASYFDEDGIVETSKYQRFNARVNVNHQLTDLKV